MTASSRPYEAGPPWAWRFVVGAVIRFLRLFGWRFEATPPDVIPPLTRPLVVTSNHTSNIEPFIVADSVLRQTGHWVQPLAKAEVFEVPVVGWLGHKAGAVPVARTDGSSREQAYDAAKAKLAEGASVWLAAEGTTTHDGNLLPLRYGAARMALESGSQMLVVTHLGGQRAFSPLRRMPERGATVTLAMDVLTPWPGEDEEALTGRIAATMMDRLEELKASHPQRGTDAYWWPPYAAPAAPTRTARDNLDRYRASMAESVAAARERMATFAEEHHLDEKVTEARDRIRHFAEEHHLDERLHDATDAARRRAEEARRKLDDLTDRGHAAAPADDEDA